MLRYVAFLRGVGPMSARMPEFKRCEAVRFTDGKNMLSSGNVGFSARTASAAALEHKIQTAMAKDLGRPFRTIVMAASALSELLKSDPYATDDVPAKAKVPGLLGPCAARLGPPVETDGARIVTINGCEVFTAYVPSPQGPVFMSLIEKTFGCDVTTRTWRTIREAWRRRDK